MSTNHRLIAQVQSFLDQLGTEAAPNLECSWEEFYSTYDVIIRRFALSIGVRVEDLDECVQEVWTALVERMVRFEIRPERARFRTWLFTIVRSKAVDRFRADERSPKISLNDSKQQLTPIPKADTSHNPVVKAERKSDRQMIQRALKSLEEIVSPQGYQIFLLRRFHEVSVQDVAAELGMSPGAVRASHHRVEQRFRKLLKQLVNSTGDPVT